MGALKNVFAVSKAEGQMVLMNLPCPEGCTEEESRLSTWKVGVDHQPHPIDAFRLEPVTGSNSNLGGGRVVIDINLATLSF